MFPTNVYLCVMTRTCTALLTSLLLPDRVNTLDAKLFPRRQRDWGRAFMTPEKAWALSLLFHWFLQWQTTQPFRIEFFPCEPDTTVDQLPAFQCGRLQYHTWYALRAWIDHTFHILYFSLISFSCCFIPSTNNYWEHYAGDRHNVIIIIK